MSLVGLIPGGRAFGLVRSRRVLFSIGMTTNQQLTRAILDDGSWQWTTDDYHYDNTETLTEFLECLLPPEFDIVLHDGSYAEIHLDGLCYGVNASGAGDPYTHRVEFSTL